MSHTSTQTRKNIVVVGGGQVGVRAAVTLSKRLNASEYNVVLINPLPYRVILPATLRLTVSDRDNLQDQVFVPYDRVFHKGQGEFIEGSVTSIEPDGKNGGTIVLHNGRRISYFYLLLSPGSTWRGPSAFPKDEKEVKGYISRSRQQFENAKHVVIIGGGAVGIEIAGEIRDVWKDKKITLVHGHSQLLNDAYPDKFRAKTESSIQARNVRLVLGDTIEGISDTQTVDGITTRNGTSIPDADLVVSCFGSRPNTDFIASSLGSEALTSRGYVLVEPTLQVKGHTNIFAAGDIIEWNEQKQAAKAANHMNIVVHNIITRIKNQGALKVYKGGPEAIFITNGKEGGIGFMDVLGGVTFGNWAVKTAKSKKLLVPMMRADSNY